MSICYNTERKVPVQCGVYRTMTMRRNVNNGREQGIHKTNVSEVIEKPPLAARCCHLVNDNKFYRRTDERTAKQKDIGIA